MFASLPLKARLLPGQLLRQIFGPGTQLDTVDDINPALPILRDIT